MGDDRQKHHIQHLGSAIMGMTETFDEILSVVNPMFPRHPSPEAARPATAARVAASVHHCGCHYDKAPPPPLNPWAAACADFVSQQLRRGEYVVPKLLLRVILCT